MLLKVISKSNSKSHYILDLFWLRNNAQYSYALSGLKYPKAANASFGPVPLWLGWWAPPVEFVSGCREGQRPGRDVLEGFIKAVKLNLNYNLRRWNWRPKTALGGQCWTKLFEQPDVKLLPGGLIQWRPGELADQNCFSVCLPSVTIIYFVCIVENFIKKMQNVLFLNNQGWFKTILWVRKWDFCAQLVVSCAFIYFGCWLYWSY